MLRRNGKELVTPYHTGPLVTEDITAKDVLESLLSDASSGEMTFPEYVSEFDLDDRSTVETYATWEACRTEARVLREFLGDDFDTYLQAER